MNYFQRQIFSSFPERTTKEIRYLYAIEFALEWGILLCLLSKKSRSDGE